jgi:hypothetical protein
VAGFFSASWFLGVVACEEGRRADGTKSLLQRFYLGAKGILFKVPLQKVTRRVGKEKAGSFGFGEAGD